MGTKVDTAGRVTEGSPAHSQDGSRHGMRPQQPPPCEDTLRSCPTGGAPSRGHVAHEAPKGTTGWLYDQHSSASERVLPALRWVTAGPKDNRLPFPTTHSLSRAGVGGQSWAPLP